ncbi:MAG: hypothetical protein M3Y79_10000 [Pseudomonadota bacterium]|nr:hypothetical protein [Pseudomonadota bacterium]
MSSSGSSASQLARPSLPVAASLAARDVLGAAWPLFKASLPMCLPLAVIGVAAGATPGAEASSSGMRDMAYTRDWWGLMAACLLLTLICYGAVLRQQFAIAAGQPQRLLESLRSAATDIPQVLAVHVLMLLPLVPAMLATAWLDFGVVPALLTLAAGGLLIYGWFAWPAVVATPTGPVAAMGRSIVLVRGRWTAFAQLAFALLASVLVFVLLVGIFIGVVMGLAGQATPDANGLALSRWLMGLVLAMPVVYASAVTVSAWRAAVSGGPASRIGAVSPPAR